MGELFTLSFYKDIPWVLAAGGSKGEVAVWDTEENENLSKHFTPFLDTTKLPEQGDDSDEELKDGDEDSDSDADGLVKPKKRSAKNSAGKPKQSKKKQIQ